MTVRLTEELNNGVAAVARLRNTTRGDLLTQYAAEQVRIEQERDPAAFAKALEEVAPVKLIIRLGSGGKTAALSWTKRPSRSNDASDQQRGAPTIRRGSRRNTSR